MSEFQYKRAPITEAVVEFRSSSAVDESKRKKALKKFSKHYLHHKPIIQQTIAFEIKPEGDAETKKTDTLVDNYSSEDITQQLLISDTMFLVSQLAPYPGWGQLYQRIKRDWDVWRGVVGFRPIERVGMRYINRIDLPITVPVTRYEDYVTVYPTLPDILDPCLYHSLNVRVNLDDINSQLNLKSAVVESPLPDHIAVLLDIDIIRIYKEPPSDEELYSFIGQARDKKNKIFEVCITDKARGRFNQ